MSSTNLSLLIASLLAFVLEGCEYVKLFRPSVLKQVTPEVAALLNELPNVDRQNKEMVGRLFPHGGLSEDDWTRIAATYAFESSPLVVDGVMFLSGRDGYVWALDAKIGQELWRYKHEIPLDTPLCCGNVNRGVAVARGKVFFASQN